MITAIKSALLFSALFLIFALPLEAETGAQRLVHHALRVRLTPEKGLISVNDKILLPEGHKGELTFLLHTGMAPSSPTRGVIVRREAGSDHDMVNAYRIKIPKGLRNVTLKYGGRISHPLSAVGREEARGFRETSGMISQDGVFLSGGSAWFAAFDGLLTFSLAVEMPGGWDAVSQGTRTEHALSPKKTSVRWESAEPQDEIYLIAAPRFYEYSKRSGNLLSLVFLRQQDKDLADKYLEATSRYTAMYEDLIGPYPYDKFALVENFWETGYGMPSFTLLGPKILRMPFIINSSYPHEILHNWWGNSVFTDYSLGNWTEGLTAYLSDHLIKEQQGAGAEHRMTTLQKYADYVLHDKDFPLTEFRSRHGSSSEAVGYGKALMLFHMLRLDLGNVLFTKGLQELYLSNKFSFASFNDVQKAFEKTSGKELTYFFDQWTKRPGAPSLRIRDADVTQEEDAFILRASIEQTQPGSPYSVHVPVAVTLEGADNALLTDVMMEDKIAKLRLRLPLRPVRIDVDPAFDVFRRLDRDELPPALSQALGARRLLAILPSEAPAPLLEAYRGLARILVASGPDEVEIRLDREVETLPKDAAVAVLGWENRFAEQVTARLSEYDSSLTKDSVRLEKPDILLQGHSFMLTARHPFNKSLALVLVATTEPESLPGLGRKLPHYHKYSYLAFEGREPVNIAKGRWPVTNSPMTVFFTDSKGNTSKAAAGRLPQAKPLISNGP